MVEQRHEVATRTHIVPHHLVEAPFVAQIASLWDWAASGSRTLPEPSAAGGACIQTKRSRSFFNLKNQTDAGVAQAGGHRIAGTNTLLDVVDIRPEAILFRRVVVLHLFHPASRYSPAVRLWAAGCQKFGYSPHDSTRLIR